MHWKQSMHKKYTIEIHKRVEKSIALHPEMRKWLFHSLHLMEDNPLDSTLDIKPLFGIPWRHYRLRIGKYRFLYEIREDEILIYIYDAGSRGGIYR